MQPRSDIQRTNCRPTGSKDLAEMVGDEGQR
jgi:hypothetical protein